MNRLSHAAPRGCIRLTAEHLHHGAYTHGGSLEQAADPTMAEISWTGGLRPDNIAVLSRKYENLCF